jgi:hypothetical protein
MSVTEVEKKVFKSILLIEKDDILKDFFLRVFFIDGFEVIHLTSEEQISTLNAREFNALDIVVFDECASPVTFSENLKKMSGEFERTRKLPILGVLSKGVDPESAHKAFDAVMIKDNFNIQLLTDLIEESALKSP